MAADCAHELRKHKVTCVSLWPGAVQTENVMDIIAEVEAYGGKVSTNNVISLLIASYQIS